METIFDLEINVVYGCNLNCNYCAHLSNYLKGYVCTDDIEQWYNTWSQRLIPQQFSVLGGEPLLHPHLPKILRLTKEHWGQSKLQLVSNGLLLAEQSADVWSALQETDILVSLSRHTQNQRFVEKQDTGIQLLETYGIRHEIRPSYIDWRKYYRVHNGKILPYSSNPSRAWNNCYLKHRCMTLMDNAVFKCSHIACLTHAFKKGVIGAEWQPLWEYSPLMPDASDEEIQEFMRMQPVSVCRLCAEHDEYATHNEKLEEDYLDTPVELDYQI